MTIATSKSNLTNYCALYSVHKMLFFFFFQLRQCANKAAGKMNTSPTKNAFLAMNIPSGPPNLHPSLRAEACTII